MIVTLLLVISLICLGVGLRMLRQKRRLALPWILIWVAIASGLVFHRSTTDTTGVTQALARTDTISRTAGWMLGEQLMKSPPARVLLLLPPDQNLDSEEGEPGAALPPQRMLEGLKDALGEQVKIIDIVRPEVPKTYRKKLERRVKSGELTPEQIPLMLGDYTSWFDAESFAEIMDAHAVEVDLVVANLDVPATTGDPSWPRLALLNSSVEQLKTMISSGTIEAAVTLKPDPKTWASVSRLPDDPRKIFDLRFLLLTPDNVEPLRAEFPSIFSP